MARNKTYDSKQVAVIYGGVPLAGFAAGSRVTLTPAAKQYTKQVGSDGESTRSRTNDATYTVKISLHMSSLSNTFLSAKLNADMAVPGGITDVFFLKDILSGTTYTAKNAWLTGFPDNAFEAEAGALEWEIETGDMIVDIKGMP